MRDTIDTSGVSAAYLAKAFENPTWHRSDDPIEDLRIASAMLEQCEYQARHYWRGPINAGNSELKNLAVARERARRAQIKADEYNAEHSRLQGLAAENARLAAIEAEKQAAADAAAEEARFEARVKAVIEAPSATARVAAPKAAAPKAPAPKGADRS